MENIIIVENQALAETTKKRLIKIEKKIKELEMLQEQYKQELYELMVEEDIKEFSSPELKITRVDPTTSIQFDSAKFKKEHLDLYNAYQKVIARKGYVKISL